MGAQLDDVRSLATALDRLVIWLRRRTPTKLSGSTITALDRLSVEGPLRISDLARREAMTQPGVTLLVNRLESAELAERVPDPTDRRASLVRITAGGQRALAERHDHRAQVLRERIAGLDDDQRRILLGALPVIELLADDRT